MRYIIKYCVLCHQGNVRTVNQDNFWCANQYLDCANKGLAQPICGTVFAQQHPIFAVFDGMGGEDKGEIASFIASNTFHKLYATHQIQDERDFFITVCNELNDAICQYAAQNHIKTMGTTGAFVLFGKNDVFICNIGDSPIFHMDSEELTQVSIDHIQTNYANGKPPLTQFLGVPESDFIIEPYVAKGEYGLGDKYLLCSDGLTDMVDLDEMREIILSTQTVEETAKKLLERALENGGKDNITIIICEICRQKRLNAFKEGNKLWALRNFPLFGPSGNL